MGFERGPALNEHTSTTPQATTGPCSEEGEAQVTHVALTADGTSTRSLHGSIREEPAAPHWHQRTRRDSMQADLSPQLQPHNSPSGDTFAPHVSALLPYKLHYLPPDYAMINCSFQCIHAPLVSNSKHAQGQSIHSPLKQANVLG